MWREDEGGCEGGSYGEVWGEEVERGGGWGQGGGWGEGGVTSRGAVWVRVRYMCSGGVGWGSRR